MIKVLRNNSKSDFNLMKKIKIAVVDLKGDLIKMGKELDKQ